MGNYPVMKCACCENQFSEIEVLRLSAARSGVIVDVLANELRSIGAKGTAQIVEVDGMIIGAIYDYADRQDSQRSNVICSAIDRVFKDLNAHIEHACEARLIEVI